MMRLIYSHPETDIKVSGVRLGPGATITCHDVYNSSDGKWRSSDNFLHTVIAKGCVTIWIRTTGLSDSARMLLEELIIHGDCLGQFDGSQWTIFPTVVTPDDRASWPVDPLAPEELRSAGLITLISGHRPPVFEVSDTGKQLLLVK